MQEAFTSLTETSDNEDMKLEVSLPGREQMCLEVALSADGTIQSAQLQGVGGPLFLRRLSDFRAQLKGSIHRLELPTDHDVASLMFSELILRARGEFHYPYLEEELCHCRAVPTKIVDCAILSGAHTPERVSRLTSASTACGTCRPDVQNILKFRLKG